MIIVLISYEKLVLEEVFNGLVRNHLLIKDVSASLGALYHLDNL